jgi:hypothetical protein
MSLSMGGGMDGISYIATRSGTAGMVTATCALIAMAMIGTVTFASRVLAIHFISKS